MDTGGAYAIDVGVVMDSSKTIKIDPEGDVILEIGTDPKFRLLVSSKVLSVASDVFKALFSPRFSDGVKLAEKSVALSVSKWVIRPGLLLTRSRSSGETYQLHLEEDDPDAMVALCYILHHKSQDLQPVSATELNKLIDFAILCDKYMCAEAVQTTSIPWLKKNLRSIATVDELRQLLITCYFLDEPATFNKISKRLVTESIDSFLTLSAEDNLHELLPLKMYGKQVPNITEAWSPQGPTESSTNNYIAMLENERVKLRHILEEGLQDPIAGLLRKDHVRETKTTADKTFGTVMHDWHQFGTHDAFVVSAYLRELVRLKLWPIDFSRMKISGVIERLHAFEEKEISTAFGFRVFGRDPHCQACILDPRGKMAKLLEKVATENKGVCLDCVKKGESQEMECRISHD